MKSTVLAASLAAVLTAGTALGQGVNAEKEVDPFIGIEGGGDVIPGPSMPFGMVKPGPDTGFNTAELRLGTDRRH